MTKHSSPTQADALHPLQMAFKTFQTPLTGPASIPVHDNRNMSWRIHIFHKPIEKNGGSYIPHFQSASLTQHSAHGTLHSRFLNHHCSC